MVSLDFLIESCFTDDSRSVSFLFIFLNSNFMFFWRGPQTPTVSENSPSLYYRVPRQSLFSFRALKTVLSRRRPCFCFRFYTFASSQTKQGRDIHLSQQTVCLSASSYVCGDDWENKLPLTSTHSKPLKLEEENFSMKQRVERRAQEVQANYTDARTAGASAWGSNKLVITYGRSAWQYLNWKAWLHFSG